MIKKFLIIYFLWVSMVLGDECFYEVKTISKNGVVVELAEAMYEVLNMDLTEVVEVQ